jgi:hypothetical protein
MTMQGALIPPAFCIASDVLSGQNANDAWLRRITPCLIGLRHYGRGIHANARAMKCE